jgi:phage pi2 protein 07
MNVEESEYDGNKVEKDVSKATRHNQVLEELERTRIAKMEELEKERILRNEEFERQRLATMEEFERQKIAPEIESKVIENKRKVLENERLQAEIQYENMGRVRGYRDKGVSWKMIARLNKEYIPFFEDDKMEPAERTMYEEMYNKYLISKNLKGDFNF